MKSSRRFWGRHLESIDRWKRLFLGVLLLGILGIGLGALGLLVSESVTPGMLRELLQSAGPYAPVLFVVLQTVQVIVAPIPGQMLAAIGGYLFGGPAGTVYSMLGVVLGSLTVFGLTRRYGERVVTRLLSDETRTRFEQYGTRNGTATLLVFFLLPTFPDDALCVIAGLWTVGLRTFLVLLVVGRTPSFFAAAYAGTSLHSGAFGQLSILITLGIVVAMIVYLKRDWFERKLGGPSTVD